MSLPSWLALLGSRRGFAVYGLVGGTLLTQALVRLKGRIKYLEYSVTHDRIGLAADDQHFGSVRVQWQNEALNNLFLSTATIVNTSSKDFSGLRLKVWSPDETVMLTERVSLVGSSFPVQWSTEFQELLSVPDGGQASENQRKVWWHQREYTIDVLNRGKTLTLMYLTTLPSQAPGQATPLLWVEIHREGLEIRRRRRTQAVLGIPLEIALLWGLGICAVGYFVAVELVTEIWAAALATLLAGLCATILGALAYKAARAVWRVFAG